MRLKTLIADDEPIARAILREELEQLDEVLIVGEACDGEEALDQIRQLAPDLVFLDLQMPGMTGFEVIAQLHRSAHIPVVVIVTAFDQHAIEALSAGAVDYLLKPITPERLARAVDRAALLHQRPATVAQNLAQMQEIAAAGQPQPARKIVARSGEEYLLLSAMEVLAFEADGDLVWIVTAKKKYQATQPLRAIQEKLRSSNFRRIHRNALVNIDHVRKMSPLSSQRWLLTLTNGMEFIVSKRQASGVRQLLSW
ncbi:MAG TPA: LytTR family DNA-binding domain-containing protein [Bryobacteraceae bacterium]|nr:LytTR family DNA-binding domain-containing protein [Bryobacteraceae bacterium]